MNNTVSIRIEDKGESQQKRSKAESVQRFTKHLQISGSKQNEIKINIKSKSYGTYQSLH